MELLSDTSGKSSNVYEKYNKGVKRLYTTYPESGRKNFILVLFNLTIDFEFYIS